MELVLLTVPDCPNAAAFEERLAAALAEHPGAVVRHRVVGDEREATEAGMHGSPTLLAGPVPSVQELRRVLASAGDDSAR